MMSAQGSEQKSEQKPKRINRAAAMPAALVLFAVLLTCGGGKKIEMTATAEVDPKFIRYVSGFTDGRISTKAVIQVELAEESPLAAPGTEIKDSPFTLTPAVKGKAFWKSRRTLEFRPDERLKGGTSYDVHLDLSKVVPKIGNEFKSFNFSVRTAELDFLISDAFYQPISNNQKRWNTMIVEVTSSDTLTDDEARSVFGVTLGGKSRSSRLLNSSDGIYFKFVIDSLERTVADQNLKVTCDGRALGSSKRVEKNFVIHSIDFDSFQIVDVQNCDSPERCIRIVFTDPVSASQDLKGLVVLQNLENYTFKTDRNVVTVFSDTPFPEVITGSVSKNIKNFAGRNLPENYSFNFNRAPDVPVVRILHTGTIMPDSRNLLFPFSAINLNAVEMRIIKIYEHNVLTFLQDNSISGSESLRRSGRLVAKKLLRLDQDKSKTLTNWNTYAVDLSALVAKEPGAIYRVELIIRHEFAIYPCDGGGPASAAALDENNFTLTEEDLAVWNARGGYYSPIEYNWRLYDWRREKDPCHPTFYMQTDNVLARGNLFASNVGVIAKRGDSDDLFVSAQDIRTANPIVGGRVRVLNYQLAPIASGVTDANGFSKLQAKNNEAFIVEVTHDKQKGYLKISGGNELSLSRFDVSGKTVRKGLKGFIYGERGIWRPGDDIFMTFILEDRAKTIPAGHPVTMDIYNPEGQFFRKLINKEPVGNFYNFTFKTNEQSPTGLWRAVVTVGGTTFDRAFRVETIKPNRLKINVDFGTDIIDRTSFRMAINAAWLHGATARGLATKVQLRLRSAPTTFKGYDAYVFNNPAAEPYSFDSQIFSGNLNDAGQTEFIANMPKAETAAGMLMATFHTTVEESGGGESITVNSMPYAPFPAYVGLNTHQTDDNEVFATDTVHHFDVVMLDARGRPVQSGELVYKAYRLTWSWWLDESGARQRLASIISGNHAIPAIEEKVTIRNGKARIPFKMSSREWGRYLIYVKDPRGGHATGRQIFVDDPRWGGRSRDNDPQGLTMLTFTTDKPEYNVGEDVKITLGKAGNGRALVSLENGSRVVRQWWAETKTGEPTQIQFKVTDDLTPNFYVHITQLQQHDQTVNDLPIRLYGVVPVTVTNPQGVLKPTITMPDVLRSEKEFTIAVAEANKRNMTYTLAIVDEGLLDINNFKTPNPQDEFNTKEALGVKTYDLYNDVAGAFSGELKPLFSIGGAEDLSKLSDKDGQRFKPVVKFLGPFQLDAGATAQHKIKLPPYVGSVRVMLVAGNDKQAYGISEKTVPVQNPLMVLTTLPRVLGPGEEALMPVNIFVMDRAVRNVKVEVKSGDLLQPTDGTSRNVSFGEIGDQIVYFKMRAKRETGKVKVTVTATSGREVSTETIDIEIRNPNPPLTIFNSYVVKPGESVEIDYEFGDEQPGNMVKLEYARIPSVNLSASLQYLIGYPHGCSEQITSQVFPQLFLHNFANLSPKQKQDVQVNVNAVIQKLYAMQTADGGIGYWTSGSQSNDWVTSFAGHFMASAKDQGYHISQTFVNNWKRYQKGRVKFWNSGNRTDDLMQTYRLYSLAVMGEPDLAAMNRLRERPNLSHIARWQLASAYAIVGRKDAARQLVNNMKAQAETYSAFNEHFGSRVRDEAIILETNILLDNMDQALAIARRISDYLNGNNYSTQTTAWALLAMARFADKSGKGDMSFTTSYLGKTDKIDTKNPVHMEDLAQVNRSGRVQVTNNGGGNIYVGRTMISTPFEDRSPAVNNNLRISVRYLDLNNNEIDVTKLEQGTDFTANVSVTNTSGAVTYTNLALTHIVPSGWEIFNTRLGNETAAEDAQKEITYQDIRDDRILSYFDLAPRATKTVSVRLQAAYQGRFFMPAVACQAMYDNTVYARTTGSWVEVVK